VKGFSGQFMALRKAVLCVGVIAVSIVSADAAVATIGSDGSPTSPTEPTVLSVSPGSVVAFANAAVTVPPPRYGIAADVLTLQGDDSLRVWTSDSGTVYEEEAGPDAATPLSSGAGSGTVPATSDAAIPACSDSYEPASEGYKWTYACEWYFNSMLTKW
jgi:hypothetical protein